MEGDVGLAASGWSMIIGYARVSSADQILRLSHDDIKPAVDASVDQTEASKTRSFSSPRAVLLAELPQWHQ